MGLQRYQRLRFADETEGTVNLGTFQQMKSNISKLALLYGDFGSSH